MLSKERIMSISMLMILLLTTLSNFPSMKLSKCVKATNGNVPKLFRCGHNNLGAGKCENKIDDIHYVLLEMKPHVFGISESYMDPDCKSSLEQEGFSVETKQDCPRISVSINTLGTIGLNFLGFWTHSRVAY